MRICFISQEYPPETEGGGIAAYTQMVAKGLAELGHEVHVICQTHGDPYGAEDGRVRVHRVPARLNIPLVNRVVYPLLPATLNCIAWSRSARRKYNELAKSIPFDIIETAEFMAQGLSFRRTPGARLVTKLHTPLFMVHELDRTPETFDLKIAKSLERRATRGSAAVFSCSSELGGRIMEAWGLPKVRTVHNPIDTVAFAPDGPVPSERHVVFAGKLSLRKGPDILGLAIPAILEAVPDARFTFVGRDTPSAPEGDSMQGFILSHLSEEAARRVTFTGFVPHAGMRRIYASAALVVVPSRYENFPYVCLEPMACGRACVASNVGGIPEIIEIGVNGALVYPEDARSLARVIIEILADPALTARLGAAARKTVEERFAIPVIAKETELFYRDVLGRSN